jgi:hypothetical protein
MDVERVVEILEQAWREPRRGRGAPLPATDNTGFYLGNTLLRCGVCDGEVSGEYRHNLHRPDPLTADYVCGNTDCGKVRAPVRKVDRELQALTVKRWSQPTFVRQQRVKRLAELDAAIADTHAVHEYCQHPQQRAGVARRIGRRKLPFRRGADEKDLRWRETSLIRRTVEQVTERAGLAAALGRGPVAGATARLTELGLVAAQHTILYMPGYAKLFPGQAADVFGDDRRRDPERLPAVTERLWALLAETEWQDAVAAGPPTADKSLAADWGKSPNSMVGRRLALLIAATDGQRLVLAPAADAGPVLRVVP